MSTLIECLDRIFRGGIDISIVVDSNTKKPYVLSLRLFRKTSMTVAVSSIDDVPKLVAEEILWNCYFESNKSYRAIDLALGLLATLIPILISLHILRIPIPRGLMEILFIALIGYSILEIVSVFYRRLRRRRLSELLDRDYKAKELYIALENTVKMLFSRCIDATQGYVTLSPRHIYRCKCRSKTRSRGMFLIEIKMSRIQ